MLTISSTPKYSVVPDSIFEFTAARASESLDSVLLGAWVFELLTQLVEPHKETESEALILPESLLGFEFCVTDHQFWFHIWFVISCQLFTDALNNDSFFWSF